jgi:hypothetical protein
MTIELPELPPFPVLPEHNQDRGLWVHWARSYAMEAVRVEREGCARICEEGVMAHDPITNSTQWMRDGLTLAAAIRSGIHEGDEG